MKFRLLALALMSAPFLILVSSARAQDASPTPAICGYPDAERALSFAFGEETAAIALVTSLGSYDPETGRRIRVEQTLKGDLPVGETTVDQRPGITCVQRDVYDRGETLLVTFVVAPNESLISTTFGLPVVGANPDASVTDPNTSLSDIDVITADGARRLDELLEAGRAYVEPTPTPAPGQTSQPTFEVPDTGVTAPNTGSGSVGDQESVAVAVGLGALALIAAACGVIVRRRA